MDKRVSFAKVFSTVIYILMGIGIIVGAILCWFSPYVARHPFGYLIFFGGAIVEMLIIMYTNLIICIAEKSCEIAYNSKNPAPSYTSTNTPSLNKPSYDSEPASSEQTAPDPQPMPAYNPPPMPSESAPKPQPTASVMPMTGAAGADWNCPLCGRKNPASNDACTYCGNRR